MTRLSNAQVQNTLDRMTILFRRELEKEFSDRNCTRCEHFNHLTELCTVVNPPARPPAKIIAYGCPAFKSDDIPF